MNFVGMRDYICGQLGKTDSESARQCGLYLRARWREIWDSANWRDSSCVFVKALAPKRNVENDQTTGGHLVLPSEIGEVIGVRLGDRQNGIALLGVQQVAIMQMNPNLFTGTGSPVMFSPLQSLATYEIAPHEKLTFYSSSADDDGEILIEGDYFDEDLAPGNINYVPERRRETIMLNGVTPVETEHEYDFVYTIGKAATTGTITCKSEGTATLMAQLYPEELSRQFVHLHLHMAETDATKFLYVLGKRQFPDLHNDLSVPLVKGIENALVALATADMWQRMRQMSKSAAMLQRGQTLLAQAMAAEQESSGVVPMLIPYPTADYDYACYY